MKKSVAVLIALLVLVTAATSSRAAPKGFCWDVATCAPQAGSKLAALHTREHLAIEAYAGSQPNNPGNATRCHVTGQHGRRLTCWVSFALITNENVLVGYFSQWARAFEQNGRIYQKRIGPWHFHKTCSCTISP